MKKCLIVDDSRVIRKVARKILEELKFGVDEAEDGAAALEICRRKMPDAILLDWNMPTMSGVDFLRALRREPSGGKPIVVYCTTENDLTVITDDEAHQILRGPAGSATDARPKRRRHWGG